MTANGLERVQGYRKLRYSSYNELQNLKTDHVILTAPILGWFVVLKC